MSGANFPPPVVDRTATRVEDLEVRLIEVLDQLDDLVGVEVDGEEFVGLGRGVANVGKNPAKFSCGKNREKLDVETYSASSSSEGTLLVRA